MPLDAVSGIYYETHGEGVPLLLGFPIMASYGEIFGADQTPVLADFLHALSDRYRVLVMDFPNIGRSAETTPDRLTADRVTDDLLAVANAAGFERFIYWGYSWGAAAGLQLAERTTRLIALVLGGWPPLGAQYADMLRATQANLADPAPDVQIVLREPAQYAQWVTFYRSVLDWPEREAVSRITCPRLLYAGENGDVETGGMRITIASTIRAHRAELESMGWQVELISDRGHEVGLDAAAVVPRVRAFLDAILFDVA